MYYLWPPIGIWQLNFSRLISQLCNFHEGIHFNASSVELNWFYWKLIVLVDLWTLQILWLLDFQNLSLDTGCILLMVISVLVWFYVWPNWWFSKSHLLAFTFVIYCHNNDNNNKNNNNNNNNNNNDNSNVNNNNNNLNNNYL